MIGLLAAAVAVAGGATTVDGDVVRGLVHLPVPAERVLAGLRDPTWEIRIAAEHTDVDVQGPDGACTIVSYVTPNPILEARYTLRRCPTATGWVSTLVEANAMSAYRSAWTVEPADGGCQVAYEVEVHSAVWVPDALVRRQTQQAIEGRMDALRSWAARPAPAQESGSVP